MFTGIIEEIGTIRETSLSPGRSGVLNVSAETVLEGTHVGDSIAVAGVCQTVVDLAGKAFTVEVMPETARMTTLGELIPGSRVNLERALMLGGRLGGHLVNGHVDSVGRVRRRWSEENAVVFEIIPERRLSRYIVQKGSIAVDGISLTVAGVGEGHFSVSVIPHTLEATTLVDARPGTRVNLEVDIIGKYVESLATGRTRDQGAGGLSESLILGGFMDPSGQ